MNEMAYDKKNQEFDEKFDEDYEDNINDKYLSFRLGEEFYGIGIKYISEIIELQKISEVPDAPEYVKGVINLRGKIIPVIDLRLKFRMPEREYDDRTCIILVRLEAGDTGLIVDTVEEVLDISEKNIDFTESSGTNNANIKGIGKKEKGVIIIINAEHLIKEVEVKGFFNAE